ncbi:hypothetical protein [Catelliglobosispora koreensis]|uniref:hypothetical protein n=1 Tax=Catelliglobosispora koreensis TaxID=129052 RepID=UPI000368BADE|nr:hypothetical protein [Catelliglobosispora koreensis]
MRELADLDLIDWSELEHAYGEAADVPDLLRSLDGDPEAFGDLLGALCHQGHRYSASAAAVPFLAGLVSKTDDPPFVLSVLMSLGYLAIGEDDINSFPATWEAQGTADADATAAYLAVQPEIPSLAAFIAHPDGMVSSAAIWLVSWFPALTSQTLPLVTAAPASTPRTIARGLLRDPSILLTDAIAPDSVPFTEPGAQARAVTDPLHLSPLGDVLLSGSGLSASGEPVDSADPEVAGEAWPEAVAAMCVDPSESSFDRLAACARLLREPELTDPTIPYMQGDVAKILAAALRLAPASRHSEAKQAIRIIASRLKGSGTVHLTRILEELTP